MSHRATMRSRVYLAKRAFTLIELMIVVAIVGILAVLGIVGYRKLILSAHTSEATNMVQSLRTAEEAYHAEAQTYVSTTADGVSPTYPNPAPSDVKWAWTTPTGACSLAPGGGTSACFALLPVHTDGPVAYGYATLAGAPGNVPNITFPKGPTLNGPGTSPTDWYWITATGNPNGVANDLYSFVAGNSFTNDLFVQDP